MEESQLLKKLIGLEESSRIIGIQIQLWHDGQGKNEFIAQKETVDNEIGLTKDALEQIHDKKFSHIAKQSMINQLRVYIEKIGARRNPIQLYRLDGVNFENSLLSNLVSHVKYIANGKQIGIHVPDYIRYILAGIYKIGWNMQNLKTSDL